MVMSTQTAHLSRPAVARLSVALLLALSALVATTLPLLACDIGINLSSRSGTIGGSITATVTVQQTHRACLVPIDDTQIVLSGVALISETEWVQVSSLGYEKQLTVQLVDAGEGRVEVARICPKGGDRTVATISIVPAASQDEPDSGAEPATETPPVPTITDPPVSMPQEAGIVLLPDPTAAEAATWTESLWHTLKEPYIVVLLSLMAAGTLFIAKGYRRARPFAMLISVGFLGFYIGGCPCPIGALQNVFIHVSDISGHMTAYVQFGAVVLVTLLFGRVFCGWACPLGATQFFLFRKEQGKKSRRLEVRQEEHNVLRWAKYGVLLVLIVLVILTGQPVFEDIDPFRALFNLDFRWGVPLVLLIVLLLVSVIIGFPFCKYLCPLGAFLGLLQPLSLFKLRFNGSCTNCRMCSTVACDYGAIEPGNDGPAINQRECVRCGECLSRCPCNAIVFTARRD
ncbi:MAG: 4Fe-4S binding protein [Dehalococcoidia bacterium]|nr:4Fe-4S binding protein [Dehalococcoidia bacterium]